jgi:hypothetical protein
MAKDMVRYVYVPPIFFLDPEIPIDVCCDK